MKHDELLAAYYKIINQNKNMSMDASDILDRGLVTCNNDALLGRIEPLLVLTGINPSYIEGTPAIPFVFCNATDGKHSNYWKKKHEQFGGKNSVLVQNEMAYLDLFPLRESNQTRFEKVLRPYNEFRFQMLEKTVKAIEELHPKMIVHANRSSLYYWGLNPSTYIEDKLNPWLGYHFSPIENNCPLLEAYTKRVSYFRDENGLAIPKEKRYVHLLQMSGRGLSRPVYFLTYIMEYYGMKEWQKVQLLSADEMTELWEWCKAN